MISTSVIQVDRHLQPDSARLALAADVRAGLTCTPRTMSPKWLYDQRGSELFDDITRLPEYYPTRRERAILTDRAREIATITAADTLVELGSGTSDKTRLLLDALTSAGTLNRFVPFDVDETVLLAAGTAIAADYPGITVHAVVGDFEHHLPLLPTGGRRLFAFLGSTIGNFCPAERAKFLLTLASTFGPDDALLLGTDLVKDPDRLIAAYDDAAGVTAEFNLNVLQVLRRELGACLDVDAFTHLAVWDPVNEWIEMRLRTNVAQELQVLDLRVEFDRGDYIRTEISTKFRRERVQQELSAAGLKMIRWWTDADADYGVSLSVPGQHP